MAVGDLTRVKVAPSGLTTSLATLYVVPSSRAVVHTELHLCNTDPATTYLPEVYFVPSAGSGSVLNQVVKGVSGGESDLPAGESRTYRWDQFLSAGYSIQAKADTAHKITHQLSLVIEETS